MNIQYAYMMAIKEKVLTKIKDHQLEISAEDNKKEIFDPEEIEENLRNISQDLTAINYKEIISNISKQIYDNITKEDITIITLNAVKEKIEKHYDYSCVLEYNFQT